MSKTSFETELRSTMRGLSQGAPTGPTSANVLEALRTRTKRRQSLAALGSTVLILAIGLSWLVMANWDRSSPASKPAVAIQGDPRGPDEQGGQQGNTAAERFASAEFNTTALLGHMDGIPFERSLNLHVAGLEVPTMPTEQSDVPGWNSRLDLDKIDFAYLPAQGDCIFCVAVPSLASQRPF